MRVENEARIRTGQRCMLVLEAIYSERHPSSICRLSVLTLLFCYRTFRVARPTPTPTMVFAADRESSMRRSLEIKRPESTTVFDTSWTKPSPCMQSVVIPPAVSLLAYSHQSIFETLVASPQHWSECPAYELPATAFLPLNYPLPDSY